MILQAVVMIGGTAVITGLALNCHIRSSFERGIIDVSGVKYYYDDNGLEGYGFTEIGDKRYLFSPTDHKMMTGLIGSFVTDGYYYFSPEDGSLQTGFVNIDGQEHYFDPDTGFMATGWVEVEGVKMFFDDNGVRASGRVELDGEEYYFGEDNALVKGWFNIGEDRFHSSSDTGVIDKGITLIDGSYYYLDSESGAMRTGWIDEGSDRYYFMTDSGKAAEGLLQFGDTIYGFLNGKMLKDAKVVQGRTLYYIGSDGTITRTVDGNRPLIALTFDDGPSQYTEQLVETLESHGARATFFIVGSRVDWYPDSVRHAYDIGCEMGNHTYEHTYLDKASSEEVANVIGRTDDEIYEVTGVRTSVLRPPGGRVDDTLKQETDLPIVLWSIDTRDWETRDVQSTINHVLGHVRDGDVILMHDIYESTVVACETIVPQLQAQGFELVTVEELGLINQGGLNPGQVYYSIRPPE